MNILIAGLCLLIGTHLIPAAVPLKHGLVQRFGAQAYKGLFSLLALAGFALIIYGKAHAPFIAVWQPPLWTRHLALGLMPFALMLIAASQLPCNVKRVTRHPMLWGVAVWAAVHLAANGDRASILLFGAFGAYALFGMWSANRRGAAPVAKRYPARRDALVVALGIAAYVVLLLSHRFLFGVSPIGAGA